MNKINNKKGFSLIELLIVLAILAVIASIAIALYGSLIDKSKSDADNQRAKQIKKAIVTYMSATSDYKLEKLAHTPWTVLVEELEKTQSYTNVTNGETENIGPFLEWKGNAVSVEPYKPQTEGVNGWAITVYSESCNVSVEPTTVSGKGVDIK